MIQYIRAVTMETTNLGPWRPTSCVLISHHPSPLQVRQWLILGTPVAVAVAHGALSSVFPLPFDDYLLSISGRVPFSLSTTKRPLFLSFKSVWNSFAVEQRISPPASRWIHRGLK
jgi:hypothetical protein